MKRLCLALIGLMALAGSAAAADLSRPAPAPYYPKAPAYLPYNWTGFYIGSHNISGGLVGGTVGYNYQWGQAVFGVEGDIDWADINGTTNNLCPLGCKTSNTWLSTVRGRLGYAADRFMPFITGGAAFGDVRASTPGFATTSSTQAGWTLGGGLEMAVTQNWTAKVEYLYVDLGKFNCGLNCGAGLVTNNVSFHTNVLRAGVNYKF
jgi:outer membrane immunogenic protein